MKQLSALFVTAALAALPAIPGAAFAQDQPKAATPPPAQAPAQGGQAAKPEALQDRASYIIGLNLGQSLKTQEVPVTLDLIIQGLRDGLGGNNALLTPEEIQAAMQEFQQQLMTQQQSKRQAEGEKNMKASQAFLDQNKAKAGVKTTASGLQYEVVTEGTGESPKPTDRVTVHYRGTLPDGTVFDSSYDRNEPATFPVNGVIPGWVEALQLMKPGAKYKLVIPPALAYGERGAGGDIGPNQVLLFDVELIKIEAGTAPAVENEGEAQPQPEPEKPPTQ
ncbi:MAG TPA: FKBP-type peptidyl-prolyl cis-trans isomerase [Thermoanaerobaculia bacterium]|nr:FKBP-type peptidyl-prolyl cis-trans isomerase [Thermoanaerobaculia bacterium]